MECVPGCRFAVEVDVGVTESGQCVGMPLRTCYSTVWFIDCIAVHPSGIPVCAARAFKSVDYHIA